jgi:hypothetical protein
MPSHKFGILRVSEQTPQSIDEGEIPHDQSMNLFGHIIVYFFSLLMGFEVFCWAFFRFFALDIDATHSSSR